MKISCEIVRDLLPLYHDDVCSGESRMLVEEHVRGCEACAKLLHDLSDELERPVNAVDEARPIQAILAAWKKDKAKSFVKGTGISLLIFAVLAALFIGLTQWKAFPVPTSLIEVSEVSELPDGSIVVKLTMKDRKNLFFIAYEPIDDAFYLTPKRAAITMELPDEMAPVSRDLWLDVNTVAVATACYVGTPEDRVLVWEEGMELPPASEESIMRYEVNLRNIFVTNESVVPITMIGIHSEDFSVGASNADNSPLEIGKVFSFHQDAEPDHTFTVQAEDSEGRILAQAEFTKDLSYNKGEGIQLYIRDGADGGVLITDE